MYIADHGKILLEGLSRLADAKMEGLLKAYEKSGLPVDENSFQEIKDELMQFCHSQQHHIVATMDQVVKQTFGPPPGAPATLGEVATNQIVRGVDQIMARVARDLAIKRDEFILDARKSKKGYAAALGKKWDVFVCHASEDKEVFVRPLANGLVKSGLSVWFDELSLKVGDSLRKAIDDGLANSRYGIVVLSKSFFAKSWPQHELDGLMSREIAGTKVILPVWHNISVEEVRSCSPMLAGLVATNSSKPIDVVVRDLREAMGL